MPKLLRGLYFFLATLIGLLIIFKSYDYFHPNYEIGFLSNKGTISYYLIPLYMHILGAPIALFTGLFQFIQTQNRLHKTFGKVYIISILGLAAPGGLFMSFYALGGTFSILNFLIMAILWIVTTSQAWLQAKKGNYHSHKVWITRSFILTNSAVLIRVFSFINNYSLAFDHETAYVIISWMSWLPWLVIYEAWRLTTKVQITSEHHKP